MVCGYIDSDSAFALGKGQVFAAEEDDGGFEGGGPVLFGGGLVVAEGFDVEADGEAFLRAGEIDEGRADDAVDHGVGVIERGGEASEAIEDLFVPVDGGEDGALAPEEVDVTGEAVGGFFGDEVEVEAEVGELGLVFVWVDEPGIAFGGEDGRARGVEGAEGVHQGGILGCFFEMIELVGIFAEIDETAVGVSRVCPWDDEDGIVGGAFGGPFCEHCF